MSKILKLVGVKTYVNALTEGIAVKRGETARFSDKVAVTMLKATRTNGENEQAPYWEEVTGVEPTYDFDKEVKAAAPAEAVETATKPVVRQRKPR